MSAQTFNKEATQELFTAISKNDLDGVKKALEAGADPNGTDGDHVDTPLHATIRQSFRKANTFPIILTLLENKADINKINGQKYTPIQTTLTCGWQDNFAFLYKQGAKFDEAELNKVSFGCPDCKRAVQAVKDQGWPAAKDFKYPFENKQYA